MAGVVRVVGRFAPSEVVALVAAAGPHVLTPAGGKTLDRARVDEDGVVEFSEDVEVGARYFVTGYSEGHPVSVRCAGVDEKDAETVGQAAVGNDQVKHANGRAVVSLPSAATLDGEAGSGSDSGSGGGSDDDKPLSGKALKDKATELDIAGRGSMKADELRAAVAAAEEKAAA